jgi:hypothetical protein
MDPAIDLERFAALSAELDAGTTREELCKREGISLEDWTRAQETWLARLADDTARKRFELTNRYNDAFVARRRALAHGPRATSPRRAAKRAEAQPGAPIAEIAPPPPVVQTSTGQTSGISAEAPFAMGAASPPIAPPPLIRAPIEVEPIAAGVAWRDDRGDAAPAPGGLPPTAVLPFQPSPGSGGAPIDLGSTAPGVMSPVDTARPFHRRDAAPAASPPPAQRRARPSPLPKAAPDDEGTRMVSLPIGVPGKGLPFQTDAASEPKDTAPFAPVRPNSALPFQQVAAPSAQPPQRQSTGGLPFGTNMFQAQQALQPQPPPQPAPAATRFTLEQFASLAAELSVSPHAAAQIRARYGIDEAGQRAESEEWGKRFAADPALYSRYGELYQYYRDWVAKNPR